MARAARRSVGLLLLAAAPACGPLDGLQPVTDRGQAIAELFGVALAMSAGVLALVAGLLAFVLLRFRARPGDAEPRQVEGNRTVEILWTVGPVLLLVVLFALAIRTLGTLNAAAAEPLRVEVVGRQWWWEHRYRDLGLVTANELHLPVGTPVELTIEAADVIHSFWVPRFGWKYDAIPGKTNTMRLVIDQPGRYDGACTEYCGTQHAWMRVVVVAEGRDAFDAWVERQRRPAEPIGSPAGRAVFLRNTCVNCHTVRGTAADGRVGPDLTHFGSRATIGAGVLDNTPANLRRWIAQTQEVKPGALMPAYPGLAADELDALVAYLEGLE